MSDDTPAPSDVQRYDVHGDSTEAESGNWIEYSDHVAHVTKLEAERDALKAENERLRGELADVEIGVCDKKRWRCLVCRLYVQTSETHYHAVKEWAAVPRLVD